ncbi:peptidoglycan editing factor PgeF [Acidithiobacillus sulfuriphilus]|uniref:Purine nucleoside phosphorylase n=2 Tax=Acidithiobacillus sulfuriphilus TaxID=1867749 RepID=A0A3M8S9W5_9PROT|nr:peptidoglycan editing factor PgeF [Acidithiobacillus sulfuriphilus]RNF76446.1 peptidoglycan editing factor PgeF [Acidithiobacillus sulfuriphilus]
MAEPSFVVPDWPAPPDVRAVITLRAGGVSAEPYASFNLGEHVGDDAQRVAENRVRLQQQLGLPRPPAWLTQVHGTRVVELHGTEQCPLEADGAVTSQRGVVLAVLTADCLPVLACRRDGQRIGVFHAGWRGLLGGILEAGMAAMGTSPDEVLIYLGPAIGPSRFEVGAELREAFAAHDSTAQDCFHPGRDGRWLADIYALARQRLARAGVPAAAISGGEYCTVMEAERFFSYRRDGRCGRMATVIWREGGG